MIERQQLLADVQTLLRTLEEDLIARSDSDELPEVRDWLQAEYGTAKEAERTALNYEDWLNDHVTQVAAAWVLSCVFVRFLEDNQLIDPPKIAGPGPRLNRARDEHALYFQDAERAKQTDREYLLSVLEELAQLPGGEVFDRQLTVIRGGVVSDQSSVVSEETDNRQLTTENFLSGDAARALLSFFQRIDADAAENNTLVHDFTDPQWDTRFLGDLYQDLSEKARKKYALLQTPDFVEEFILDRTLEPALDEFGLVVSNQSSVVSEEETDNRQLTTDNSVFKMIDPACGSGHFLLGAFPRILSRWQKEEPGTNVRELVQRTLDSIYGVDINPFAVAIARFRLLLAALAASGVRRLADAPAFAMNLACGDSLYHGVDRQKTLGDWTDESHYFRTEDADNLRRILQEGTFHAVVANPPYINVADPAANQAYRRLYKTCHKAYSLAVPFMERIFRLAIEEQSGRSAYVGQITANSFTKREFGKKLIEEFFPLLDLTHFIDTSGAYIPGHGNPDGIPTAILFARNRTPVSSDIRFLLNIKGEPSPPEILREGEVWSEIVDSIDAPEKGIEFMSVSDVARAKLEKHPWALGAGGAAAVKREMDDLGEKKLKALIAEIGRMTHTGEDDCFYMPTHCAISRDFRDYSVPLGVGEDIRDYAIDVQQVAIFPYDKTTAVNKPLNNRFLQKHYWGYRPTLRDRVDFGNRIEDRGLRWIDHSMFFPRRYRQAPRIIYPEIATHPHFVPLADQLLFKHSAGVICFKEQSVKDRNGIVATLNSSMATVWARETLFPKGGFSAGKWEERLVWNSTNLKKFPLPSELPSGLGNALFELSSEATADFSSSAICRGINLSDSTEEYVKKKSQLRASLDSKLIRLQEDLDWECYRLYGLLEDDLTYQSCQSSVVSDQEKTDNCELNTEHSIGIQLGERAFEIVLARKMAQGEVQTTWFERHGSQPITELPRHWPDDYKRLVQRRIEVIESNPQIALIEQPEYKRRWNTEPWDSQVQKALRSWLLDRLESYFDFDGRMREVVSRQLSVVSGEEKPTDNCQLTTTN